MAYKYSLVNAEQKNYIQTNVITITKMITVTLQILVILFTGNFYLYLLTAAAVELLQKIFVSCYLNRLYPYLLDKQVKKLSHEETGEVVRKTKALVLHKVGGCGETSDRQYDHFRLYQCYACGICGKL